MRLSSFPDAAERLVVEEEEGEDLEAGKKTRRDADERNDALLLSTAPSFEARQVVNNSPSSATSGAGYTSLPSEFSFTDGGRNHSRWAVASSGFKNFANTAHEFFSSLVTVSSQKLWYTGSRFALLTRDQCAGLAFFTGLGILMLTIASAYTRMSYESKPANSNFGCDAKLSPPHVSNRTVGRELCVRHRPPGELSREILAKMPPTSGARSQTTFLVVGDFGRDGLCCQRDVALEMARAASTLSADFVINVGDAFYEYGLLSSEEEQVRTSFDDVYNVYPSLARIPFYSALGNHEYRGTIGAVLDLDRTRRRGSAGGDGTNPNNFVMPNRYYDFFSEDRSLHVVVLDTSPMIKAYTRSGYDDRADTMINAPDGISTQWDFVPAQLVWLDSVLGNSTAPIKVVVGHHPVFTSGSHYREDENYLRTHLTPIFEKHNVHAYFSGHDHNMQIYHRGTGPKYYVSAGGSKVEGAFTQADEGLAYFNQINGFFVGMVETSSEGPNDAVSFRVGLVDYLGNVLNVDSL